VDLDDALAELVTESGDRLLRVAYQLTHDRAAAQDLVQDALLRVYRSIRRRGVPPGDWYAYLRRAVINEYLSARRLRSSGEVVTDRMPEQPVAGSPEDQIADRAQLWAALGALTARQRAALVLRYYEDLPDHQIAALLGCREASVRSLASRGLAVLRQLAVPAGIGRDDAGVPAVGPRAPQAHLHPAAQHHRAGHQPGVLQDRPHLPGCKRARHQHAPYPRRHKDRHRHTEGDHRVLRPHRTAPPVPGPVPPRLVRLAGCAVGRPGRPRARRLRPPRQAHPLRPRPHPRRPHREHVHPDPPRRRPGRSDRLVDVPLPR
jgi:RNA polymerase sigma-70 factor (sigma-E family)